SALGRARNEEEARAADKPGPTHLSRYDTFGLYYVTSACRQVRQQAGRGLCLRLVRRWLTKDASPVRGLARGWVQEQWQRQGWDPEQAETALHGLADQALGHGGGKATEPRSFSQVVEAEIEKILQPLSQSLGLEAVGKAQKVGEFNAALLKETIRQLEELL